MNIVEKLNAMRELMRTEGLHAYIVPGNDPHASEYMAEHWREITWLSGFKGETGTVVVTLEQAFLWTDSRYYLQAEKELAGSGVELMRASDIDCPTINQWLCEHADRHRVVGVNPEMWSIRAYNVLCTDLKHSDIEVRSIDLIRPLWTDNRPDIPLHALYEYEEQYAGESVASKIERVREALRDKHAQALVIAELDEICWLLNVRGKDVDFTPCVISYVVLEMERCTLFIDPRKLPEPAKTYLQRIGIETRGYEDVFPYLNHIQATGILFDGARVNEALFEAVSPDKKRLVLSPSPVQVMMSVKNEVELSGERTAMLRDAVALTRFFHWLYTKGLQTPQTEVTLVKKLTAFRALGEHYTDDSFGTIAGWNANGAIVHYAPTEEQCAKIEGNGVLLLDSGGQYFEGTTDITRTVWVGDEKAIPAEVKHDFTLVLKGHIALARAQFPKGTRGNQIDILARQFLWAEGVAYTHGTGHGVGHFQGCHEGPAQIRTDNNPNPIRLGNVFSDEPGIYRAGEYGIRTENLVVTIPAEHISPRTTGEEYFGFETITLCYYDTRLIEMEIMTAEEIAWINAYHQRVYAETAPLLEPEVAAWLKDKCKEI